MAPTGQGGQWQDVLCCTLCNQRFEQSLPPISLICGHVICRKCSKQSSIQKKPCPNDDWKPTVPIETYPTNVALLSVILPNIDCMTLSDAKTNLEKSVDQALIECSKFFRKAESERGGSVYSHRLSRTLQRKVVSLICYQWLENDGKIKCLKTCRAIAERIMTEILLSIQSNTHVSSQLWTAVRARGCQFLGPAMQEDVLRLILMTLENGDMIARKTLVLYAVSTLVDDYSQVSKTCVGHVVQLLYRASCFNVIKRDGESSLMQLKEEFRTYDALRREHDSQIVQIAFESGLRIGPDQWSALLYADQGHRSHMQSIIDKLQSPNSYAQCLEELIAVVMNPSSMGNSARLCVNDMMPVLTYFATINYDSPSIELLSNVLHKLVRILKLHAGSDDRRRYGFQYAQHVNSQDAATRRMPLFKTKMCSNMDNVGFCEKGTNCSFAHSEEELRNGNSRHNENQNNGILVPQNAVHLQRVQHPPQLSFMPHHGMPPPMQPGFHKSPPPMTHFYPGMHIPPPPIAQQVVVSPQQQPPQPMSVNPGPPPPGALLIGYPAELSPQHYAPSVTPHPMTAMPPNGVSNGSGPPPMMIMQSPNHMPAGPVVMMPPPSQQTVVLSNPPQGSNAPIPPNTIWAAPSPTGPTNIIFPGAASPGQHPHTIWIPTTQTSIFPMESFDYGNVFWGAQPLRDPGADADQLLAKRNEILHRLAPHSIDEDDCEDGGVGHVSYTVASSVLDDTRMDGHHPTMTLIGLTPGQTIDLPAMPVSFGAVPNDETMTIIGDFVQSRPRAGSISQPNSILAQGQMMQSPYHGESTSVASTVQSECANNVMPPNQQIPLGAVVTTIPAPLPGTETFVPSVPPPPQGQPMIVDGATGLLTPLIRPILVQTFPQDVVSCSLDKIVDVKERISEAQGCASEAENAHLRRELRQAESEMAFLDPYTKNSCLLRELQQVENQLQQFQIEPSRTQ